MRLIKTKFKDLLIIKTKSFNDLRGLLKLTYDKRIVNKRFVFDYSTTSKKNVFRGFHLQNNYEHSKIITVISGEIIDYVIDLRKKSKTYKKIFKIILSAKNSKSILIPKGFAHGYYVRKNKTIVYCKQTNYYKPLYNKVILMSDKNLKIKFPFKKPILSSKDSKKSSFSINI